MGDHVLMKTLLSLCIFSLVSLYANELELELQWVKQQVEAIKPKREGGDEHKLSKLQSPFIFLEKNKSEKKKKKESVALIPKNALADSHTLKSSEKSVAPQASKQLKLDAIINNTVLINGKWYTLNEKVRGYTITDIRLKTVTLIKNKQKLVLSTKSEHTHLKFNNK